MISNLCHDNDDLMLIWHLFLRLSQLGFNIHAFGFQTCYVQESKNLFTTIILGIMAYYKLIIISQIQYDRLYIVQEAHLEHEEACHRLQLSKLITVSLLSLDSILFCIVQQIHVLRTSSILEKSVQKIAFSVHSILPVNQSLIRKHMLFAIDRYLDNCIRVSLLFQIRTVMNLIFYSSLDIC